MTKYRRKSAIVDVEPRDFGPTAHDVIFVEHDPLMLGTSLYGGYTISQETLEREFEPLPDGSVVPGHYGPTRFATVDGWPKLPVVEVDPDDPYCVRLMLHQDLTAPKAIEPIDDPYRYMWKKIKPEQWDQMPVGEFDIDEAGLIQNITAKRRLPMEGNRVHYTPERARAVARIVKDKFGITTRAALANAFDKNSGGRDTLGLGKVYSGFIIEALAWDEAEWGELMPMMPWSTASAEGGTEGGTEMVGEEPEASPPASMPTPGE